jgi:endonuclease/exonuclease/phosphatase (EEP) superfamily protein YafD
MGQSRVRSRGQRMVRWLAPLLLLGWVFFGRSCARVRPVEQAVAPSMRLLTYNLDKDSANREAALAVIDQADPDVIFFQEASAEWQQLLTSKLRSRYPHVSFNRPKIGYDGIGMMSKFPIVEERLLDKTGGGWFPSQLLVLETPVGRVQFLNVHLRPPSSDTGNKVVGYLTTGGVRRKEIEGLFGQLRPVGPTIVVGDFNEGDGGQAVEWLKAKRLTDALPEFDRQASTWQGQYLGMRLTDRPDHVMYSAELRCFEARVIPEIASDHDPVLAVVGLRAAR